MPQYRVEFTPAAERQFDKLAATLRAQLRPHIDRLALDPRPPGCKKLKGAPALYRIRVGNYRVIYQVRDQQLVVSVVKVADRKDAY